MVISYNCNIFDFRLVDIMVVSYDCYISDFRLVDIIGDLGKKRRVGSGYIVWQEVVDNGVEVKPDTVVQIWMGNSEDIRRMTEKGLRTLYSSCWYLDAQNYGIDWTKYYTCRELGIAIYYQTQIRFCPKTCI